jgi:hypothetical protein
MMKYWGRIVINNSPLTRPNLLSSASGCYAAVSFLATFAARGALLRSSSEVIEVRWATVLLGVGPSPHSNAEALDRNPRQ